MPMSATRSFATSFKHLRVSIQHSALHGTRLLSEGSALSAPAKGARGQGGFRSDSRTAAGCPSGKTAPRVIKNDRELFEGETGSLAVKNMDGSVKKRSWYARWWFYAPVGLLSILVLGASVLLVMSYTVMGKSADGDRLARMEGSPQWKSGKFVNPKYGRARVRNPWRMAWKFMFGSSAYRVPTSGQIDPHPLRKDDFEPIRPDGLRVTWLGHSILLVEIDGRRVLIDPVWGERASPFRFAGPKRFYAPPLPSSDIPDIDVVLISHDHYDHLDYEAVRILRDRSVTWIVPLGVGAHLEYWGVPADRIVERDWWESTLVEDLTITATPARHFSGRSPLFTDSNGTLWAGWVVASKEHRIYYSGDTAMFDGFTQIRDRLGPFDITMLETGAYNAHWADVHMGPEQAIEAHQLLGGGMMIPVHWGLFDLALHGWTEPIERILAAAEKVNASVAILRPGESVELGEAVSQEKWWPDVPWESAAEAPVVSSQLSED